MLGFKLHDRVISNLLCTKYEEAKFVLMLGALRVKKKTPFVTSHFHMLRYLAVLQLPMLSTSKRICPRTQFIGPEKEVWLHHLLLKILEFNIKNTKDRNYNKSCVYYRAILLWGNKNKGTTTLSISIISWLININNS